MIAAMTTSIPEAAHSGRNWDYRYCWLRDAYYVLGAFRLLGHFEEREQFINYLLGVVGNAPNLALAPLYRIEKRPALARKQGAYSVISATGLIVKRWHELENVLRAVDKSLKLVAT